MCKHGDRWGMAVAMAALAFGLLSTAWTVCGQDDQTIETFKKGMAYYEAREYARAKEAFDAILAADPGMAVVLKMGGVADIGLLIEMKDNALVGADADALMELIKRAQREANRDVRDAATLLDELVSVDAEVYAKARVALQGHGPYVVPYVISLLTLEPKPPDKIPPEKPALDNNSKVGRAMSLLAGLQRDACLPLMQVLQNTDNPLLRQRTATVLGQIGDVRAVPILNAVLNDPATLDPTRAAASEALRSILGEKAAQVGPPAVQYVALAKAYFVQDAQKVGFTYGMSADVWMWDPAGADLEHKLVYEQVPNYLYYQKMATDTALAGLAHDPANGDLKALLAGSLVRQLALCKFFSTADARLGGKPIEADVKRDAEARAAVLEVEVPVALRMLTAPIVGRALQLCIQANDGPASLYLVKTLGQKLEAAGPAAPEAPTTEALEAGLSSGDKDVRYNAAISMVKSSPRGEGADPAEVIAVLSAALRTASARNALVLIDDIQTRNKLVNVLRTEGLSTSESPVNPMTVEAVLALQPSVDVVFMSANAPEILFTSLLGMLKSDPRTKAAPLYVIVDPASPSVNLADAEGIEKVYSTDHIRTAVLKPVLEEKVLAQSRTLFTDAEEALILKAASALEGVDPLNTQYDLKQLEPAIIKALTGYKDDVSAAAIGCLAQFGTPQSLAPLAKIVSGGASTALKTAACDAMAAILKRTGGGLGQEQVDVLKAALRGNVQEIRQAAAEGLGVAGLSDAEMLELLRTEALGQK